MSPRISPRLREGHAGYGDMASQNVARMNEAISGICSFPPLAVVQSGFARISCPVLRQYSLSHIAMKRRMRPIANAGHDAVFHRIVMDVIDMSLEVLLVADRVFPVSSLPKRKFAVRVAPDFDSRSEQAGTEDSLDSPPPPGEIRVSRRQGQNRMKVI